jgi:hypothetical protein
MANQTKGEAATALKDAGIERKAFTIPQFCTRNGDLSEGFYRKMRKERIGPQETRILDRVIITVEAETKWRREREAASKAEAKAKIASEAASDDAAEAEAEAAQ